MLYFRDGVGSAEVVQWGSGVVEWGISLNIFPKHHGHSLSLSLNRFPWLPPFRRTESIEMNFLNFLLLFCECLLSALSLLNLITDLGGISSLSRLIYPLVLLIGLSWTSFRSQSHPY